MTEMENFNEKVINEFRANGGKVGGMFEGAPVLLLHTTGAKSGAERVNPLMYQPLDGSFAIFASAGGSPKNPDWYYNLAAHPDTTVEMGTDNVQVRSRVADGDERDQIWARQKSVAPGFAEYETNAAPRQIPVIVLDPVA